mmetsp:Transcript_21697/g.54272  ORF Transcript_21697/g.54272 Transcript_21697/m.54272 type:complete len:108 (+) Transcript_21697:72-395(+)
MQSQAELRQGPYDRFYLYPLSRVGTPQDENEFKSAALGFANTFFLRPSLFRGGHRNRGTTMASPKEQIITRIVAALHRGGDDRRHHQLGVLPAAQQRASWGSPAAAH